MRVLVLVRNFRKMNTRQCSIVIHLKFATPRIAVFADLVRIIQISGKQNHKKKYVSVKLRVFVVPT